MFFTSYKFIGFVILLVALYYVLPKKAKWPLLLLGSYVFYFFAGWKCLFYIAGVTVITYVAGLLISKNKKSADARFAEMKALEKSGSGSPEKVGKEARKRFKEAQKKKEDAALSKEKDLQRAMLEIRKKFGNNAIVKGVNMHEESTGRDRNKFIGGHKA